MMRLRLNFVPEGIPALDGSGGVKAAREELGTAVEVYRVTSTQCSTEWPP